MQKKANIRNNQHLHSKNGRNIPFYFWPVGDVTLEDRVCEHSLEHVVDVLVVERKRLSMGLYVGALDSFCIHEFEQFRVPVLNVRTWRNLGGIEAL